MSLYLSDFSFIFYFVHSPKLLPLVIVVDFCHTTTRIQCIFILLNAMQYMIYNKDSKKNIFCPYLSYPTHIITREAINSFETFGEILFKLTLFCSLFFRIILLQLSRLPVHSQNSNKRSSCKLYRRNLIGNPSCRGSI